MATFVPSNDAVEFSAQSDAEFVLGSAVPHNHDLVLGYYSVDTNAEALRESGAHISAIKTRLVQKGRLQIVTISAGGELPPIITMHLLIAGRSAPLCRQPSCPSQQRLH